AQEALRAWWRYRRDAAAPHTEGVSYDGFLMDSFTDWIDGLPGREALLAEGRDAFASLIRQWVYSTLPGRPDLHAPLGDVEGEMPFWISCIARIVGWYGADAEFGPGLWLIQRMDPARLPSTALAWALDRTATATATARSEERRVGKECRSARAREEDTKKGLTRWSRAAGERGQRDNTRGPYREA